MKLYYIVYHDEKKKKKNGNGKNWTFHLLIFAESIRKFLEANQREIVIFCLNQQDCGVYEVLAPLYFPRNQLEETSAVWQLPKTNYIGISGELSISDRQIRITRNPQHTIMIGSEFIKSKQRIQKTHTAQLECVLSRSLLDPLPYPLSLLFVCEYRAEGLFIIQRQNNDNKHTIKWRIIDTEKKCTRSFLSILLSPLFLHPYSFQFLDWNVPHRSHRFSMFELGNLIGKWERERESFKLTNIAPELQCWIFYSIFHDSRENDERCAASRQLGKQWFDGIQTDSSHMRHCLSESKAKHCSSSSNFKSMKT